MNRRPVRVRVMLFWALIFLVAAVVAGVLGFGTVGTGVGAFGQIIFFLVMLLALVFVVARTMRFVRNRGRRDDGGRE